MADAMVISDWITVMNSFNLAQIGTPYEIYQKPDSRFDADFIGTMNFISSVLDQVHQDRNVLSVRTEFSDRVLDKTTANAAVAPGGKMYASIRPEDVEIFSEPPQARENFFKGIVVHMGYLGNFLFSSVSLDNTTIWLHMFHHMLDEKGDELHLFLNPEKCMVLS